MSKLFGDDYVHIPLTQALAEGDKRFLDRIASITEMVSDMRRGGGQKAHDLDGSPHGELLAFAKSHGVVRDCICCSLPFASRGSDNVVCNACRVNAPEFDQGTAAL